VVSEGEARGAAGEGKKGHIKPHFDADGGCRCVCPHCVGWKAPAIRGDNSYWMRVCICRKCNESCATIRLAPTTSEERARWLDLALRQDPILVKVEVTDRNDAPMVAHTLRISAIPGPVDAFRVYDEQWSYSVRMMATGTG
jgi:hypothetical protein